MRYLALLLLLFTVNAFAQQGIFYDDERDGEGILVFRDARMIVSYIFTYGAWDCEDITEPSIGPIFDDDYDCRQQGQRWFFLADNWNVADNESTGFLFMARGKNFPEGIPDKTNPFAVIVGEALAVGVYIMRPSGNGYQMRIVKFGDVLKDSDPIYDDIYQFTTQLFPQ